MDRRTFNKSLLALTASGAVLASSGISAKSAPKVLMLGGRDFFGPNIVSAMLDKGYQVTLFNRGFTNPDMFPQLNWIRGDREINDGSGLANLKKHLKKHTYDLVVDTWQKSPKAVADMTALLKDKIGHYQYVSSISVYQDRQTIGIDENYPLEDVSKVDMEALRHSYAQRKTLSELAMFDTLGDKATTFRSHGMRSDRTPSRIYEPYWPVRFYRGGEILLPKDENHVMQVCDVTSMTRFMLHSFEQGHSGAFNVAYPTQSFVDYLKQVEKVTSPARKKVWVSKQFLAQHGIEPYRDLPFWRPQLKGFYHINVEKALKAGLDNRPYPQMIKDQLAGYLRRNPKDDYLFGGRGTISPQKEQSVLKAWWQHLG